MVQLSDSYIVVDQGNHCLRELTPTVSDVKASNQIWRTSLYAGECTEAADIDNRRKISRFNSPQDVIIQGNYLFLTDTNNGKIKKIDMTNDRVTTVHQSEGLALYNLVSGSVDGEFYVTAPHGVLHIRDQKETWLVGGECSAVIASSSRFSGIRFKDPTGIQWVNKDTLVVADSGVNTIKVIDLVLQHAQSICAGSFLLFLNVCP